MTTKDIIRMAREAGWDIDDLIDVFNFGVRLERFANLAAAAEREACARMCNEADKSTHPADLAEAIRARGENT